MKKAIKHTAKKVASGNYLYRGWTIKRFSYASLGDPEGGLTQWNIYAPNEANWTESESTLSMAKWMIDTRIQQLA